MELQLIYSFQSAVQKSKNTDELCLILNDCKLPLPNPLCMTENESQEQETFLDWREITKYNTNTEVCKCIEILNQTRFKYACFLLCTLDNKMEYFNEYVLNENNMIKDKINFTIDNVGSIDSSTTYQSDIDITLDINYYKRFEDLNNIFFRNAFELNASVNKLDKWFDMNVYIVNFSKENLYVCDEITMSWSMMRLSKHCIKYDLNTYLNINIILLNLENSIKNSISLLSQYDTYSLQKYLTWDSFSQNNYFDNDIFYENHTLYPIIANIITSHIDDISNDQKVYYMALATYTSKDQYYTLGAFKHILHHDYTNTVCNYFQSAYENLGFMCEYIGSPEKDIMYCHDSVSIHLKCAKYLYRVYDALVKISEILRLEPAKFETMYPFSQKQLHEKKQIFESMNQARQAQHNPSNPDSPKRKQYKTFEEIINILDNDQILTFELSNKNLYHLRSEFVINISLDIFMLIQMCDMYTKFNLWPQNQQGGFKYKISHANLIRKRNIYSRFLGKNRRYLKIK